MSTVRVIKEILAKLKRDPTLATTLADDADLVGQVGLDSLEILQFMLDLEARLRIRIDFDTLEFETLTSIERLGAFLDQMPRLPAP